MNRRRLSLVRTTGAALALSLFAASCGLKPAAVDRLNTAGNVDPGLGNPLDPGSGGTVIDPNTGQPVTNPSTGPTSGPGSVPGSNPNNPTDPNNPANPNNPNNPANPNNPNNPGGGTTIGISPTEIRIGLHAPITNAAPIPNSSFTRGATLYWDENHKVFGRNVKISIEDDQYRPSVARQRCEKLAADSFLVIGGAGTDQIQACATDQVLRAKRTPYLSAGVTENGLRGLPDYFAVSTSYPDQARLVMKYAKSNTTDFPAGAQWGLVVTGTANFEDALTAMKAQLDANSISYQVQRTSKDESSADAQSTAGFLNTNRFPVVYFLTSPTYFTQVIGGLVPGYNPTFTGVGVSMGLNAVANLACSKNSNYNGHFLSPSPGLDIASQNAHFTSRAGSSYDDLMWLLYGISEILYKVFQQLQGPLTRENFIAEMSQVKIPGGVFPPLDFTRGHFGGTHAWMLKSDCNYTPPGGGRRGAYRTVGTAPIAP